MRKEPEKIPLNPDAPRSKNVTLYKMPPLIEQDNDNKTSERKLDNNENTEKGTET